MRSLPNESPEFRRTLHGYQPDHVNEWISEVVECFAEARDRVVRAEAIRDQAAEAARRAEERRDDALAREREGELRLARLLERARSAESRRNRALARADAAEARVQRLEAQLHAVQRKLAEASHEPARVLTMIRNELGAHHLQTEPSHHRYHPGSHPEPLRRAQ